MKKLKDSAIGKTLYRELGTYSQRNMGRYIENHCLLAATDPVDFRVQYRLTRQLNGEITETTVAVIVGQKSTK